MLADSRLLVPVEQDPGSGEVGLRASVNADGSRHLLGFTTEELTRWAADTALGHLRDALAADGSVSKAWLLAGAGAGAADVVLVVAREIPEPSPGLARALQQVLPPGASGDIYPISTSEVERGDFESLRLGVQVFPES